MHDSKKGRDILLGTIVIPVPPFDLEPLLSRSFLYANLISNLRIVLSIDAGYLKYDSKVRAKGKNQM
jgi:hypothetical protein